MPAAPFDAPVLTDGAAGVKALQKAGQTRGFIKAVTVSGCIDDMRVSVRTSKGTR